ncbi:hypothetical protein [Sphingobium algorifonticola]|uniref:DUF3995 domain-containing protein n=1 Tax=Sphingobium algorifonticola TaxID=2008318 RepID=A0A437JBE7_9SPHN|nr:hypothetical protein [Sphingobium algorifonticola]RVT43239.1 hypothetical protein ENE74_00965 [Sphingobium algorifonticola]
MKPTILPRLLRVFGMAFLLMGLLWVGQGTGYVKWPAESFMIDMRPWAWRGAGLAGLGAAMLALSARLGR